VAVLMIVGVTLLMFGCDSGTDTHNVDGDYAVGTVQFVFGENQTWTLRDVLITIDTRESRVYFSGIDRDGLLWGYSGRYSRSGEPDPRLRPAGDRLWIGRPA
jgi:hypothetical protein